MPRPRRNSSRPSSRSCAERAENGVGVDAEDGGEVLGGRQALAGLGFAVGDRAADLAGDLLVELEGVVAVDLDTEHGASHSSSFVREVGMTVTAPPRPPRLASDPDRPRRARSADRGADRGGAAACASPAAALWRAPSCSSLLPRAACTSASITRRRRDRLAVGPGGLVGWRRLRRRSSRLDGGRLPMGRTAVPHTLSRRRRAPRTSSMWAPRVASSRAGTAGAAGTAPASPSDEGFVQERPADHVSCRRSREHRQRCMRLAALDDGGHVRQELFKSTNGGRELASSRIAARLVFVSPADPATVYAITGEPVGNDEPALQEHERRPELAAGRPRSCLRPYFWGVAFDPTASSTVYAATGRGVLKSTDGGVHWQRGVVAAGRCPRSRSTRETRRPCTPGRTAA